MSENTKGTEPRVLSTFIGDDMRDRQIAEMRGGVATRALMKGDIWSPWVGADAEGREIARLAASNRALVEQNARYRGALVELDEGPTNHPEMTMRDALQEVKRIVRAALSPVPAPSAAISASPEGNG